MKNITHFVIMFITLISSGCATVQKGELKRYPDGTFEHFEYGDKPPLGVVIRVHFGQYRETNLGPMMYSILWGDAQESGKLWAFSTTTSQFLPRLDEDEMWWGGHFVLVETNDKIEVLRRAD